MNETIKMHREYLRHNQDIIQKVYDSFGDFKSKEIYKSLMQLQETGDYQYLINAVSLSGFRADMVFQQYLHLMRQHQQNHRPLVLYGLGRAAKSQFEMANKKAGRMGYLFYPFITEIPWTAFCDKNPNLHGTYFREGNYEKLILSPEELWAKYPDAYICVSSAENYDEIKKDLTALGFLEDSIILYSAGGTVTYEEEQYFDREIVAPQKERFFVDGGCYRLDTVERFCKWNNGLGFEGFLSFEPDPTNFDICMERFRALPVDPLVRDRSQIIQAGLSDHKDSIHFSSYGNDESCFEEIGNLSVPLVTIDEIVGTKAVSFIKLDVEGYELQALQGGIQTIRGCRPRMAVCAYHKLSDLIDIPEYILSLNMGYQLYFRIYSNTYLEFVIYAI